MLMQENQSPRMSERAYAQLKDMIIRLEYPPGAHLEESELMARLRVGRTPLREAMQLQSKENLVTNIHRKGYFASNISINDPHHIFEVRRQLESFSARLAAERATAKHIAEFYTFLADVTQNLENADFNWNVETDRRFHQLIAKATDNPFLQEMLDHLFNQSIRVLNLFNIGITEVRAELPIYREILNAIENHRPDEAVRAMKKHLPLDFTKPIRSVKTGSE
jgi:DNA-binding GntR family transcriptional regulator